MTGVQTCALPICLVAPLSVINALIVAVGLKKKEEISRTYATLESIWEEYQVYEKTEGAK